MVILNRRKLLQTSACLGSASLFSIYPQPAQAWVWLLARAVVSFSGRTVGRQAVRSLARSGVRAAKPVQARTRAYATRVKPYYPRRESEGSYPFAEYLGKELGQYAAESSFDYLYNLNNAHYGGASQVIVVDDAENSGGVGFSTGERSTGIADFHVSHVSALDICSEHLQNGKFTSAEITGLLYPVVSDQNNFSSSGYRRTGYVKYNTAFGYVEMESYHAGQQTVLADVYVQDQITDRYFRWNEVFA